MLNTSLVIYSLAMNNMNVLVINSIFIIQRYFRFCVEVMNIILIYVNYINNITNLFLICKTIGTNFCQNYRKYYIIIIITLIILNSNTIVINLEKNVQCRIRMKSSCNR